MAHWRQIRWEIVIYLITCNWTCEVPAAPPPLSFISSLKKQLWRLTAWTMSPDLKNLISGAGPQVPHMSNCMWFNIVISSYLPSMSHNFWFKLRTPCLGLYFFFHYFLIHFLSSFLLSFFPVWHKERKKVRKKKESESRRSETKNTILSKEFSN